MVAAQGKVTGSTVSSISINLAITNKSKYVHITMFHIQPKKPPSPTSTKSFELDHRTRPPSHLELVDLIVDNIVDLGVKASRDALLASYFVDD